MEAGYELGATDGGELGCFVGFAEGASDGREEEGKNVGFDDIVVVCRLGSVDGDTDGIAVGLEEGTNDGFIDTANVGLDDFSARGAVDGKNVGNELGS